MELQNTMKPRRIWISKNIISLDFLGITENFTRKIISRLIFEDQIIRCPFTGMKEPSCTKKFPLKMYLSDSNMTVVADRITTSELDWRFLVSSVHSWWGVLVNDTIVRIICSLEILLEAKAKFKPFDKTEFSLGVKGYEDKLTTAFRLNDVGKIDLVKQLIQTFWWLTQMKSYLEEISLKEPRY